MLRYYTMNEVGFPPCAKCGGLLELNEWPLEERVAFETQKEKYLRCINCGKITSPGIILNQLDPDRLPIGDKSKRNENKIINLEDYEF